MRRTRLSLAFFVLGVGSLLSASACSLGVDDLFNSTSGNGGAGGSASSASKMTTGVQSTTSSPTTGITATAVTNTVGATMDVASSGPGQGPTSSSTGMPPDTTVDCVGGAQCNIATSVCCYNSQSQNGGCTSADDCKGNGATEFPTAISCQVPSQCATGICCAHRYFMSNQLPYETTSCSAQCQDPDRFVCDPLNNTCPNFTNQMGQQQQMFCKASTILPMGLYFICSTQP